MLFFATTAEARAQGYRACKRCRPDEATQSRAAAPINAVVHELARQIEANPEQAFRLTQLAQRAGYSPFHLQRNFKAIIGSTPKEYQTAARLRTLKQELRKDAPVSDAIYQAGFGSGSRVYEKADGQLGMTPSEYRSGGKGLTISYASGRTPLGLLMIGATDRGICFLQFGDSDRALQAELRRQFPAAAVQPMPATHEEQFESWMAALNRHLRGLRAAAGSAARRARHGVPADRVALPAEAAVRRSPFVLGSGRGDRQAERGARRGTRMRIEQRRAGDSVSSRRARHGRARRLSLGRAAQARAPRHRARIEQTRGRLT